MEATPLHPHQPTAAADQQLRSRASRCDLHGALTVPGPGGAQLAVPHAAPAAGVGGGLGAGGRAGAGAEVLESGTSGGSEESLRRGGRWWNSLVLQGLLFGLLGCWGRGGGSVSGT